MITYELKDIIRIDTLSSVQIVYSAIPSSDKIELKNAVKINRKI